MENIYQTWTEFNKSQTQAFNGPGSSSVLQAAQESADQWRSQGYPKGEEWKYVKYNNLPNTHFHLPEEDAASVQKADENFTSIEIKNFSRPQKLDLSQLPQGLAIESELELGSQQHQNTFSHNPFAEFSKSFVGLGFQIHFKKGFKDEKPVKLVLDLDSYTQKDLFLQQNISIVVEESVESTVFVEVVAEKWSGLCNLCFDCQISPGATLNFYNKEMGGPQSHCVLNLEAFVGPKASFNSFDMTLAGKWSRHNLNVTLQEKEASTQLKGAYLNSRDHFVDHHTSIRHEVGHTESLEDYRGILGESAQAVFNGKVFIAEKAAKSNSEQMNNLMLSKTAEVDTKPELQIYNDDVKAAHGATVGKLDEEQRFYLQSRGYSPAKAKQVLAKAFIYDLIEDESDLVKEFYDKEVHRTLDQIEASQ